MKLENHNCCRFFIGYHWVQVTYWTAISASRAHEVCTTCERSAATYSLSSHDSKFSPQPPSLSRWSTSHWQPFCTSSLNGESNLHTSHNRFILSSFLSSTWFYLLPDFGRDLHSSDNELESQAKFCFLLAGKQRTISPISCRSSFTKFEHNTLIGVTMKTFATEMWKFYCEDGSLCSFYRCHKI